MSIQSLVIIPRLSYGVWLMQEMSQQISPDIQLYMMYDVACTLVKHLKLTKDGSYLLDRWKFALPSFHAYGHNAACQVKLENIIITLF